jgi:hypothetical protein
VIDEKMKQVEVVKTMRWNNHIYFKGLFKT